MIGKSLWLACGLLALGLGLLGMVLPLLPTTPFLLLAAFCFARSSERLHDWLMDHRHFGPVIDNWRQTGAIAPRHKRAAALAIAATFALSLALGVSATVLAIQAVFLGGAALFVLTRPGPPPGA